MVYQLFIPFLILFLCGGCRVRREAVAALAAADYHLLRVGDESVRCDAFYRFFGSPESISRKAEVRGLLGKSRLEVEEFLGVPSSIEVSQHDPDWRRIVYFFEICPASASAREKEKWILGYYYIVSLEFRSETVLACSVGWPRVYELRTGVVR